MNSRDLTIGLPGLRGTDHIGFTVPNLQQAVDFFVNVIGCEPIYELGPFSALDDWMHEHLNVHPDAVMKKLKFLRCKSGSNFEIFEYVTAEDKFLSFCKLNIQAGTIASSKIFSPRSIISINL